MEPSPRARLVRTATLGMLVGVLLAALLLMGVAWWNLGELPAECPPEDAVDCVARRERLQELIRLELIGGVALGLIAVVGYLVFRFGELRANRPA